MPVALLAALIAVQALGAPGRSLVVDARMAGLGVAVVALPRRQAIAEITRLYETLAETERSKILLNESFGYRKITVERPLRVSYEISDETIRTLHASKVYAKLRADGWSDVGPEHSAEAFDGLTSKVAGRRFETVNEIETALARAALETWSEMDWDVDLDDAPEGSGAFADAFEVTPATARQILACFTVRSETAPIVTDSKGQPEPDPGLRDTESVPLYEDIDTFLEHEVRPFASDAWVDDTKTKVGYEIPFTRHFYKYVPPRPLTEIDADIKASQRRILELLAEVTE